MASDVTIVGAGISGCTAARLIAEKGFSVEIIEKKKHIAGNCFDEKKDGILIHTYGPKIFHTKHEEVYRFLSRFTRFLPYKHRVLSRHKGTLYPMPINLVTFNRFFGLDLDSEGMKKFLEKKAVKVGEVRNSRDAVISKIGEELYSAFIKHYTKKQWDAFPEELDRSVLERLPVRYDTNDLYFDDPYQGMPDEGYTEMCRKIIDYPRIKVMLSTDYRKVKIKSKLLICTAPIDEHFDHTDGKLPYRSLRFELETLPMKRFQEASVVNYPDPDVSFTRITEFTQLTGQAAEKTVIAREYPTWEGDPMYPVPKDENKMLLEKYLDRAKGLPNVMFLGRLGRYKYLNMDAACKEAMELSIEAVRRLSPENLQ